MKQRSYRHRLSGAEVPVERWAWRAVYKQGNTLEQFDDETGEFHKISEISVNNLDKFELYKKENPEQAFSINMKKGQRPLHFYRNWKTQYMPEFDRRYCFGVVEKGIKKFIMIFPDDSIQELEE